MAADGTAGLHSPAGVQIFFSALCHTVCETHPALSLGMKAFFTGVKRPYREADHLLSYNPNALVKNEWNRIPLHHTPSWPGIEVQG